MRPRRPSSSSSCNLFSSEFISMVKVAVNDFSWPPLERIPNMLEATFDKLGNYSDQGTSTLASPTKSNYMRHKPFLPLAFAASSSKSWAHLCEGGLDSFSKTNLADFSAFAVALAAPSLGSFQLLLVSLPHILIFQQQLLLANASDIRQAALLRPFGMPRDSASVLPDPFPRPYVNDASDTLSSAAGISLPLWVAHR